MATLSSEILEPPHPVDSARSEIDTSAPFESVKEAANRFGGMGFWKPVSHKPSSQSEHEGEVVIDVFTLEEHASQLERDLIAKERETLDVLKELETTKNFVEELKLKLQQESSEINAAIKETSLITNNGGGVDLCPSAAPGFILLELKQAKLNLTRTTNDLADIRATVDVYNKRIEKERLSLEKTRQRLSSNTLKISCLEEELNQARHKLEEVKDTAEVVVHDSSRDSFNITKELEKLSSETEQFKKVGEAARSEVLRAMSEIEETKTKIRTAEIRLIAAKKMKEAARASEAVAFAEIKALSNTGKKQKSPEDVVTLSFEEYSSLVCKARGAEQECKAKVVDAMLQIDEANVSKSEILKSVEEATEEVKMSKRALEEALSRVEIANTGKLAVEEALRVWRSEHGHKRRSVQNTTKFKNSSRMLDVNGLNLAAGGDGVKPVLKSTLSIGQILSRKLLLTEEYENGVTKTEKTIGKRKVSLGQMLSKPSSGGEIHSNSCAKKSGKENNSEVVMPVKRKKFGFGKISLLVAKQSKKKNKKNLASKLT
ncbi:hypothetical protein ABFS82_10G006300 [Erythranthe guttata]|uniref:WEB family protein n=1 Tax=Erythranthe guttata TaxID=4155 RepID=A0A022RPS1_ERYGU|nr:PREDICTED: WEB family protein At2g38370 [Erythranthe guttata]EYU41996.1 hypothetical protein MIMGU_mgv1a004124mg [Erythranthe guttata]|eukprot:XP_012832249.1 PREDICTED: WEB family protein At2g38370 [Erythranthe guttata]